MKVRITESLDVDLVQESWCCNRCSTMLGSARENYKHFLRVADRDPREVHNPYVEPTDGGFTLSPDPAWCRLIEFYCPNCATLIETEYLPPGHPITHDIELDLEALKAKHLRTETGSAA